MELTVFIKALKQVHVDKVVLVLVYGTPSSVLLPVVSILVRGAILRRAVTVLFHRLLTCFPIKSNETKEKKD
jgi:hypothetical protein